MTALTQALNKAEKPFENFHIDVMARYGCQGYGAVSQYAPNIAEHVNQSQQLKM